MSESAKLRKLKEMFGDYDMQTLKQVLDAQGGNVQAAASYLIDEAPSSQSPQDALFSMLVQHPQFRAELMQNATMMQIVAGELGRIPNDPGSFMSLSPNSKQNLLGLSRVTATLGGGGGGGGMQQPTPAPAAAAAPAPPPQMGGTADGADLGPQPAMQEYRIQTVLSKGWMEKQSGGKAPKKSGKKSLGEKLKKWDIRFFVLTFDAFYYFKYEEDFLNHQPAKGRIMLDQNVFFMEIEGPNHMVVFRSLGRVFRARVEGPVQFQWWGDVMRAAYLIQMRTWSAGELDQWAQLCGASQTDMFSCHNVDGTRLVSSKSPQELHAILGLGGTHNSLSADCDRIFTMISSWRTEGTMVKLQSMKGFLDTVAKKRKLKDYEQATNYVIGKCAEIVQHCLAGGAAPPPAPTLAATGGGQPAGAGGGMQGGEGGGGGGGMQGGAAGGVIEFMTCGWLEKQSGGHNDLEAQTSGKSKRKLTFGQAVLKWDIRFCVLDLDHSNCEFVLRYYKNKEEWQAQMMPKGVVPLGISQVELLRSMTEPVDYRMTIRGSDRVYSFRASLKDLKLWMGFIRSATLSSAARWNPDQLVEFIALCGVTDDMINVILSKRIDGRALIGCRTMNEMLPLFGLKMGDSDPTSDKFLLAKDVEKVYDTFDKYRMYASTMKLATTLDGLNAMQCSRKLNQLETEQKERITFLMECTQSAPSAVEVLKEAEKVAAGLMDSYSESGSPRNLADLADDDFNPRAGQGADDEDAEEEEDEWDEFSGAPLPSAAPAGQPEVAVAGITAAGVARRRASLAPQAALPEVDHNLAAKAMKVSAETEAALSFAIDSYSSAGGGGFMAAVEEDV